jgi:hypothetical protein
LWQEFQAIDRQEFYVVNEPRSLQLLRAQLPTSAMMLPDGGDKLNLSSLHLD